MYIGPIYKCFSGYGDINTFDKSENIKEEINALAIGPAKICNILIVNLPDPDQMSNLVDQFTNFCYAAVLLL